MIDLQLDHLETVKRILALHVPQYEVLAFGSRVSGSAKTFSDLDLVVMTDRSLPLHRMARLREALSESNLPIKVDVVDWADTDEGFRTIIRQASEVVQNAGNSNPKSAVTIKENPP